MFVSAFLLSIFSSFSDMGEIMTEMMKGMPEGLMKGFGMSPDAYTNATAFYSTYYGMHLMILMGIYAITLGANILSKEEREKTSEFLLTRPITRTTVINSKLAAYFTYLFALLLIQTMVAGTAIAYVNTGEIDWSIFQLLTLNGSLLVLLHGALGWILSLLPKRGKSITGPLIGIVVGGFVLNALSNISKDSSYIGWFSPFYYRDFNVTSPGYSFDYSTGLAFIALIIVCHISVYLIYNKKDLTG